MKQTGGSVRSMCECQILRSREGYVQASVYGFQELCSESGMFKLVKYTRSLTIEYTQMGRKW